MVILSLGLNYSQKYRVRPNEEHTKPSIKESILDVRLYKWYGSAALPVYIETHKELKNINSIN